MRKFSFAAVVLWGISSQGSAQLFEPFDYEDGPLSKVSGGTWIVWPDYDDAPVVSGAVQFSEDGLRPRGESDVYRPFAGVLTESGQFATFSFDFNIRQNEGGKSHFWISPYENDQQVVDQFLRIRFDPGPFGDLWIRAEEGLGNGTSRIGFRGYFPRGSYTVSGLITRVDGWASYELYLNKEFAATGAFALNHANGISVAELYSHPTGRTGGFAFDNIEIQPVPEPITVFGVLGAVLFVVKRRRANRN